MGSESRAERSWSHLPAILREAGLRVTASRLAVLAILHAAPRPMSHGEVVKALAADVADRATIYRNLIDFVRVGLARKTELGDRVWRYEMVAAGHSSRDHPHFVCNECGNVQCLPGVEVAMIRSDQGPRALRDRQFELQFRGYCDDCR